jgi:hypothetical protein
MARFLRFVVDCTLGGKLDGLKEYSIGVEVFDRGSSFDPPLDPVVRVEARRLRKKLEEYYEGEGAHAPVRIQLPKGGYAVEFDQGAPEKPDSPSLPSWPWPSSPPSRSSGRRAATAKPPRGRQPL